MIKMFRKREKKCQTFIKEKHRPFGKFQRLRFYHSHFFSFFGLFQRRLLLPLLRRLLPLELLNVAVTLWTQVSIGFPGTFTHWPVPPLDLEVRLGHPLAVPLADGHHANADD